MKRDVPHLLDAALLLVAGAIVVVGVALRADASTRPLALSLALAATTALVLRRSAPTATLAISGALVLALFAVDHAAGAVGVIAPAIALYSFALSRGRVHLVAAVVAAAATVMIADVFLAGPHPRALTLQTAAHVALVAVPLLAAEALRNRRAYIQLLLERLELAERTREEEAQRRADQERLRIARELHDVVAHTLTMINVQAGVAALIAGQEEMEVAGEAGNGREAVDSARRVFPHVVVRDVRMPVIDGLEATRLICADPTLADTRVLMLTTFDLDEYVYAALRAGASGFLLKDAGPGELLHAIRIVAAGKALLAPRSADG